jgi:SAM-dependent methyltransferase
MYIFQPDRYLLDKQIRKFSHYIKGKVLDVGAGEVDRYGKYFKFNEYIKMDPRHGDKVDLVGSADNIPLNSESIDSIVCTQVFEHLENPQKSAEEIYRVLKKDGYALLTVPQWNELHEEPYDFFRYTKFGLKSMFEKAGFEIVEIDQRGGYYSLIAQMIIRHNIDKYGLYKNIILGKTFAPICKVYGKFAIWLDSMDKSVSNRKHTLGWCIVLKK